jgi:hypothetical protein
VGEDEEGARGIITVASEGGGAVWANGGKVVAATLGPHRIGVLGHEGAKFQTEIGAGWNGGAHGPFI